MTLWSNLARMNHKENSPMKIELLWLERTRLVQNLQTKKDWLLVMDLPQSEDEEEPSDDDLSVEQSVIEIAP